MSGKGKNSETEQHLDEIDEALSRMPDNGNIVIVRGIWENGSCPAGESK